MKRNQFLTPQDFSTTKVYRLYHWFLERANVKSLETNAAVGNLAIVALFLANLINDYTASTMIGGLWLAHGLWIFFGMGMHITFGRHLRAVATQNQMTTEEVEYLASMKTKSLSATSQKSLLNVFLATIVGSLSALILIFLISFIAIWMKIVLALIVVIGAFFHILFKKE